MNKRLAWLAFAFVWGIVSGEALGATLSLTPASQSINPGLGETASVNLEMSGLGDFAPPSLGAFLVEVTFDDSILSFDSVTYGSFLGDPTDPLETSIITTPGVGSVSLDEFSFLFDFELDALQPSSFILATLVFTGDTSGTSPLGFGAIDLSDAVGTTIDPFLETASVTSVTAVSEPPSIWLFGMAAGGLLAWGRRKRVSWILARSRCCSPIG